MTGQFFEPEFRVLHLNSAGAELGYIRAVSDVDTAETLDQVGSLTLTIAASDEEAAAITEGSQFKVYDPQEGYLGRYVFKNSELLDAQGDAVLRVECWSSMIDLQRLQVGFSRFYGNHTVEELANELTEIHSAWTCNAEINLGYATASFEGETILGALTALRDKFKLHFRLSPGYSNRLDFGNLGDDRDIRFINLSAMPPPMFNMAARTALIESISERRDGDSIANRIIALGAGQGTAQLTMAEADYVGNYTLINAANQNDTLYYYVEDTISQAKYGVREAVVVFSDIKAFSTDANEIIRASNQLKRAAEAYLAKYKNPTVEYRISVRHLHPEVYVGDTVELLFQGATDGVGYLHVDGTFTVVEVVRRRSSSGARSARVTISSTGEVIPDDSHRIANSMRQSAIERMHVQAVPS